MLVYPVVENGSSATPADVVVAFTLFAPRAAQPLNGQVVQFKAKDSGSPRSPIVAAPTA